METLTVHDSKGCPYDKMRGCKMTSNDDFY